MPGKFTHYLITRFNVPVVNWHRDKLGKPTLDEAWMKHRMLLFLDYCVPSVLGQTVKNFTWIIYCEDDTASHFVEVIRQATKEFTSAQIRWATDFDTLMSDLRKYLAQTSGEYIITSRVDNDDGLGKDYIRQVQLHFIEQDKTIINIKGGASYDIERKVLTEIRSGLRNHFGSLIEKKKPDLTTIIGFPHDKPPPDYHTVNVPHAFGWIKIIHDRNLSNRSSGLPVSVKKISGHYAIPATLLHTSPVHTAQYFIKRSAEVIRSKLLPASR